MANDGNEPTTTVTETSASVDVKTQPLVVTKDMWEIIFLITFHVEIISVRRGQNLEGKNESTFSFPASCQPLLNDYLMNKTIPVSDFRDVKRAMEIFKKFTR
jgi:hypothetical protein